MRRILLVIIVSLLSCPLFSFELGAAFDLSNLDFSRDRASVDTGLPGESFMWGVSAFGRDQLAPGLELDLLYTNDTVLRNVAFTRLSYVDDYFSIRFGPFFGVLNAPGTFVQSGISTTVELFVPGIAFVRLRSDNSLSGRLVVTGDYIQEKSELALGFYLENVIPTVYLASSRYSAKTDLGETIDSLNEYGVRTDLFQKNVPYRVNLNFAYQTAGRQFIETVPATQTYGSVVLGLDLTFTLLEAFTVFADLESSIYTFGLADLLGEVSADSFLFRLSTGLSVDLSKLTGN